MAGGTIQWILFAGTARREYVGADNQKHRPVMLHRAILGSLSASSAY